MEDTHVTENAQEPSVQVNSESSPVLKRKRHLNQTDFTKIARDVDEDGPNVKKAKIVQEDEENQDKNFKKYGDPSIEVHLNRLQAIEILLRLQAAFPEVVERVLKEQFDNKKPTELTEEEANRAVASAKFLQSVKSTGKINMWAGEIAVRGLEDTLCTFTPIKAQGLSVVAKDPDFQELWKEVTIDMMTLSYMEPKYRLGLYMLKNLYILHHINCSKEDHKEASDPEK